MVTKEAQSLGGKKMAKIQRDRAVKTYYENPNKCLNCGAIIDVGVDKVSVVKRKKFCDRSCSAVYNNKKYPKRIKVAKPRRAKKKSFHFLDGITKGEFRSRCSNWQSWRTVIRRHAAHVYSIKTNNNKICERCGYDKHIQVCHIKPVSDFDDDDLIFDINKKNNLMGLCPNCHWELDHEGFKI